MFKQFFLLICIFFTSFVQTSEAALVFTPGEVIIFTGATEDARFDIADTLYGYDALNARLNTNTKTLSGVFYAIDIGWIWMSTGSYQVSLNCGGQSLSNLSENCAFSGKGWNENIGEVNFEEVIYTTGGLLSGSATSLAGNINLAGIGLGLLPIRLDRDTTEANRVGYIDIKNAWIYEGSGSIWNIELTSISDIRATQESSNPKNIDFSLASEYQLTIIDSNGSKTEGIPFTVQAAALSSIGESGGFFAQSFCENNTTSILCPDDNHRTSTTLTQEPPTEGSPVIANGADLYTFTLNARDTYGNEVKSGEIAIKYRTSVKNIQTNEENFSFFTKLSFPGDAIIGEFSNIFGERTIQKNLALGNNTYTIASTAPTNASSMMIYLESIHSNGRDISLSRWKNPLTFISPYDISVISETPIIGRRNTIHAQVTQRTSMSDINPAMIMTLEAGELDIWKDMRSNPDSICTNTKNNTATHELCDWEGVTSIATYTGGSYDITGEYEGGSEVHNPTSIKTYVFIEKDGKSILYPGSENTLDTAIEPTDKLHVIGQSSQGFSMSTNIRSEFIGKLRQQAILMSRNRSDYNQVDYEISLGNRTITGASLDRKRTIVVIGGDINITEDILSGSTTKAIIALSDIHGNGGNISMSGSVKDIHAMLIAEKSVVSETTGNQLYIHGSLISANPPTNNPIISCPYFIQNCTHPSSYDLPSQRGNIGKSQGGEIYPNTLIIEWDQRLLSDPPPIIKQ